MSGTAQVAVEDRTWHLSTVRLLWIPAGVQRELRPSADALTFPLLFQPDECPITWDSPQSIRSTGALTHLVRVLLQPSMTSSQQYARAAEQAFEVIPRLRELDLELTMPRDPRAVRIAHELLSNPAATTSLEEWGRIGFTSAKTLQRLFVAETGLTFPEWRTVVRIRKAIDMLCEGASVTMVANRVGYSTPSGFIAAFSRITGHTPARYIREMTNRQ